MKGYLNEAPRLRRLALAGLMRLSELYDMGLVRSYRFDPRNKPDVKKQAQLEQARLSVNQQIEVQWIAIMNSENARNLGPRFLFLFTAKTD